MPQTWDLPFILGEMRGKNNGIYLKYRASKACIISLKIRLPISTPRISTSLRGIHLIMSTFIKLDSQ